MRESFLTRFTAHSIARHRVWNTLVCPNAPVLTAIPRECGLGMRGTNNNKGSRTVADELGVLPVDLPLVEHGLGRRDAQQAHHAHQIDVTSEAFGVRAWRHRKKYDVDG